MDCDLARLALSAGLDGEASPRELDALDAHLAGCPGCLRWSHQAAAVHRAVRVRPAEPVPDLVAGVLARAAVPTPGRGEWVRYALGVVAATNLLLGLPALLLGSGSDGVPVHVARHLGAFVVAISLGLLYCAWRPHRAAGLLPVAAALVTAMVAGAVADVVGGDRPAIAEVVHLFELAGLVLLWMLAGRPRPANPLRPRRLGHAARL